MKINSLSINKNVYCIGFAIILLSIFSNCKTSKKATTTATPTPATPMPKTVTVSDILTILDQNQIKADWMSSDVGLDYEGKPMNVSASMTARYRRDSLIWVNVKKLGFNVARAKITPDSVFIVNYLQGNYIAQDLKYLERKYNLPADFNTLQNILLGNPVFLTDKSKLKMERDAATNDIILRGADNIWQTTYRINATDFSIKTMLFEQPIADRSLKIECENYQILRGYAGDSKKFAFIRRLLLESLQSGKVKLELEIGDNIEINVPKTIKFEIPSHYEKMD